MKSLSWLSIIVSQKNRLDLVQCLYIVIAKYNMQAYVARKLRSELDRSLERNPVTALLGPRQSGKSTLARHALSERAGVVTLDLDLPSDLRKLSEPELFFREHGRSLVCIDEIQQKPDLFPILRALVDTMGIC